MTQAERLKKALMLGTEVLDKVGVPYIITGGTLLGIYRENSLLEHDRDVDVDVLVEDIGESEKFLKKLNKASSVPFYPRTQYFTATYIIDEVDVPFDIFVVYKRGDKRFRSFHTVEPDNPEATCLVWPEHHYRNLGKIKFEGKKFNIPSDVENYLVEFFGDGWRSPVANWAWNPSASNVKVFKDIIWEK